MEITNNGDYEVKIKIKLSDSIRPWETPYLLDQDTYSWQKLRLESIIKTLRNMQNYFTNWGVIQQRI